MEHRHIGTTSSAPAPRGISSAGTSSAPPARGISSAGKSSAPPSRASSVGELPPRPTPPLTAKTRRRSFVVPAPRLADGAPVHGQDSPSPGDVLPLQHRGEVLAPSGVLPRRLVLSPPVPSFATAANTTRAPPPLSQVDDLRADPWSSSFSQPGFLPSPSCYQPTRSGNSTLQLGFQATEDDPSSPRMPVFDWTQTSTPSTANSAGNDAICSQGFTNLMTQDDEPDLEILTQLRAPASGSKGASKRGSNYNHDEDIQLCMSWMNISNDPVVGNDQGGKAYWTRIANHYNENRTCGDERNANSVEHRWAVIQKDCIKFQGYYEAVERRHRSGIPFKEHLIEAQARYSASSPKGKAFQLIHCWLKVRHCEKFISLQEAMKQGNKPSRSSTPSEGHEGGHDPAPDSSVPPAKRDRPPGRKQSKDKLKRSQGGDDYEELLGNLVQIKTAEHKQREERWNRNNLLEERRLQIEEKREERRLQIEEKRLEWEKEREIMFCDISKLDGDQRTYVLAMRAQIAKEKVASLSSAGSVSGDGDSCA